MELEQRVARLEAELARSRRRTLATAVVAVVIGLTWRVAGTRVEAAPPDHLSFGEVTIDSHGLLIGKPGHAVWLSDHGLSLDSKAGQSYFWAESMQLVGNDTHFLVRADSDPVVELGAAHQHVSLAVGDAKDPRAVVELFTPGGQASLAAGSDHAEVELKRGDGLHLEGGTTVGRWTVSKPKALPHGP